MQRRLSLAMLALVLCGFAPFSSSAERPLEADSPAPSPLSAGDAVPGEFIVLLKDTNRPEAIPDLLTRHQITTNRRFDRLGGFAASLSTEQVNTLRTDADVRLVEPNYRVSAFPVSFPPCFPFKCSSSSSSSSSSRSSSSSSSSSSQKSSSSSSTSGGQPLPTGINRINAEQSPTAKIDGQDQRVDVDVAVIDTGVQANHPDLNVFRTVNFTNAGSADDGNGHGTHVAGTIGALDNNTGVVGVAPGARIWGVKVLGNDGSGAMSDIVEGINYVIEHASEIEVANMSLGCECTSSALNEALSRATGAGVVFVVAAGNAGKDSANFSPANHPDVIAVSAIADFNGEGGGGAKSTCRSDVDDTLADFSNFGNVVDIAAPGVCIKSTWKGGGYNTISGTSMASPHVAGAAALYIFKHGKPGSKSGVESVKNGLRSSGFPQDSGPGFTGDRDSSKEPLLNASSF